MNGVRMISIVLVRSWHVGSHDVNPLAPQSAVYLVEPNSRSTFGGKVKLSDD
jgi:hypothetical protein